MQQWIGGGASLTQRLPCPPAPGPLEDDAARFDDLFETRAQRRSFRAYLHGLLLPRERNKTLTALAGAEPIVGAQHPDVQRLPFFLFESPWDANALNVRRLELLLADPQTLPALSTWYVTTNLPHPQREDRTDVPFASADLAEVVRAYGFRQWVEQSYRQVKHELGWADFMVRADQAIRRHRPKTIKRICPTWRGYHRRPLRRRRPPLRRQLRQRAALQRRFRLQPRRRFIWTNHRCGMTAILLISWGSS